MLPKRLSDFIAEWNSEKKTVAVHTSGSTGEPKMMLVEKERMAESARRTCVALGLKAGDTALLCMPLDFIAGKMMVVRAMVAGLTLVEVEPSGHPLSSRNALPDTINFLAITPQQLYNTLQVADERERLARVHIIIIGGGAVNEEMARELKSFTNDIYATYGMTETLSHIALRRLSGEQATKWFTPMEGVAISLSARGTLVIDAPHVCPTLLETNDLAVMNSRGQFKILGRTDNTINSGGIKIQAEELEDELRRILNINELMVTSRTDEKFGEALVLMVKKYDKGQENDQLIDMISERCRTTLPPHKRPKMIIAVDQLPTTATGKPDRAKAKVLIKA